jgi:hypothetical protein
VVFVAAVAYLVLVRKPREEFPAEPAPDEPESEDTAKKVSP